MLHVSDLTPSQPKLLVYPVNKNVKNKTNSFKPQWYKRFEWLEYDVGLDAALCYCCRHFTKASDSAFVGTGYKNWPKALDTGKGFTKHENAESHRGAYVAWKRQQLIAEGAVTSIAESLDPDYREVTVDNKDYILMLLKYVLWFTTNEIAPRGHDESVESGNRGNWLSFIALQINTNTEFKRLHSQVTKSRMKDYTSKTSFNSFMKSIAECVRREVYAQVAQCKVFSVLIDESKDKGKRQELALAVRYVSSGNNIKERFVDLNHLVKFDAHTIADRTQEYVSDIIQKSDGSNIISLGADGASVMSGEHAGVGELLRSQHYPWMLYIHCSAHRLNLVVNDIIKSSKLATDVIATLTSLYTFLNHPKVRLQYEKVYKRVYPKKQVHYLVQQFEIRWACKFEAVDFLAEHPNVVLQTLADVSNDTISFGATKHAEEAAGFYHKMIGGKFIVSLVATKLYLAELDSLSKELQQVNINWTDVEFCLQRTRAGIAEIDDEAVFAEAELCSDKMCIPLTMTLCMAIHNTRNTAAASSAGTAKEQVMMHIVPFRSFLKEKISKELDTRFSENNLEVMKACEAFNAGNKDYLCLTKLGSLTDQFDCFSIRKSLLRTDVARAKKDLALGLPIHPRGTENLSLLQNTKNVLSTSTASVERAFSCMNRICTKIRSKVTSEHLGDLMVIALNRDIALQLSLDNVIEHWEKSSKRRIAL